MVTTGGRDNWGANRFSYHETSVCISLSTEEVRFADQSVFNHVFPPTCPICSSLAWPLSFTASLWLLVLLIFVAFCSDGWLQLPRDFRAMTCAHVPTAFPCLAIRGRKQIALGGKRKCAPTSVGVIGALSYLAVLPLFLCCMYISMFQLYYYGGCFWPPTFILLR